MSAGRFSTSSSFSSDSDDEEDWSAQQKKRVKTKRQKITQLVDTRIMNLEEGEISSDELEEEDDGLDENLIGGEDDKRKLEKMTEKEREEELFKRAERRDAIQARLAVKRKLKEKRDRERAVLGSHSSTDPMQRKKIPAYSEVFSSDSNQDVKEAVGPRGLQERKVALEKKKEAHTSKFSGLIELRRKKAAKKRRIQSGDEDEDLTDSQRPLDAPVSEDSSVEGSEHGSRKQMDKKRNRAIPMSQQIFPDASDSSDSDRPGLNAHRPSPCSLSDSSEDDARGRSRSPEEQLVSSLEELSRIRLSRFKMEKWVHMPFFDDLIKGCFVRINIGLNQGVPVYRCAEIVDVLETPKIYDLGDTRTNKGIVVRVGKDQSTFRLAFVSNSNFLPSEFDSWMRRITDASIKPPSTKFVTRKAVEIQECINKPIKDDRVVEQIIQSKKRFQRAPTNFAMRKAELIKQRELAESEGDMATLNRLESELEEIESLAERIDRRRTLGFKSITSINQRNRMLSVQQAEEAIKKESEEALNSKEEDPFTRVHSQPVIVTKKYLEQLRHKRSDEASAAARLHNNNGSSELCESASAAALLTPNSSRLPPTPIAFSQKRVDGRVRWSITGDDSLDTSTPHDSLHAIHNFEININLDLDGASEQQPSKEFNPNQAALPAARGGSIDGLISAAAATVAAHTNGTPKSNRRLLNLQEYKKRFGLI